MDFYISTTFLLSLHLYHFHHSLYLICLSSIITFVSLPSLPEVQIEVEFATNLTAVDMCSCDGVVSVNIKQANVRMSDDSKSQVGNNLQKCKKK